MYNYLENMVEDVKEAIPEHMTEEELASLPRHKIEEKLLDELWIDDSVTGNASGSYTFNSYMAEEYLCHNMDLLEEACSDFGIDMGEAVKHGSEYCAVTIRCNLLSQAIAMALDDMYK